MATSNTATKPNLVLAISSNQQELEQLRKLFSGSNWDLQTLGTVADAAEWLAEDMAPVVLCSPQLADGTWKDLLRLTEKIKISPNIVVTSRLADDRLWAEVLNLGGYDVLALPATAAEVFRTVGAAWRNWKVRSEIVDSAARTFPPACA